MLTPRSRGDWARVAIPTKTVASGYVKATRTRFGIVEEAV